MVQLLHWNVVNWPDAIALAMLIGLSTYSCSSKYWTIASRFERAYSSILRVLMIFDDGLVRLP